MKAYLDLIEQGATIVTATQRLARAIVEAHERTRRGEGAPVWDRPDALPFAAFVDRAYDDLLHAGALGDAPPAPLGPTAELIVWERVIRDDEAPSGLLDVAATADMARKAWKLQQDWQMPRVDANAPLGEDQRAYGRWAGRFADECRRRGVIDRPRLPIPVAQAWEAGAPVPRGPIVWAGFDEATPLRERLDRALRGRGVETRELDPAAVTQGAQAGQPVRTELPAVEDELRAFAGWARRRLERDPGQQIALVLADVDETREQIEGVFGDVLAPQRQVGAPERSIKPWNVSKGPKLADYAMVRDALGLLRAAQGYGDAAAIGSLVRSPYVSGASDERSARAQLDVRLREGGEPQLSLERLRRQAERTPVRGGVSIGEPCPRLAEQLRSLREVAAAARDTVRPSVWAERFDRRLRAVGWPGDGPLDSTEHQLLGRWRELLGELAGLDAVLPAVSEKEAVARIAGMAAATDFQPRSPAVPIQVLGALEAAGLTFDALWVAGLHDGAWPRPARPNPFLPLAWQRERGLHDASPALAAGWAARLTERLASSAREVVLSSPQVDGERELRPSPLLDGYPAAPAETLSGAPVAPLAHQLRAEGLTERIGDGAAPPVREGETVAGGTRLFADQAACPFRGFAHHRLHAQGLEAHARGIDARVRGKLLHETLERLWSRLGDSERLNQTPLEELAASLRECAAAAVEDERSRHPAAWTATLAELEVDRLVRTASQWLKQEGHRPPFEVEGCEISEELSIGGITVHVRLDRIDRLASGRRLVVDYKTGRPRRPAWFDERMDEPQLPLYAVHVGSARLDGAALVYLRPDGPTVHGIARERGILPGLEGFAETEEVKEFGDIEALIAQWRGWLEPLAAEIRKGRADVAPKKPPQTCQHCDLRTLCRVNERLGEAAGDADGQSTGGVDAGGGDA